VGVPETLTPAEKDVWERLAPHARRERTLTEATAERFRLLCHSIVAMDKYWSIIEIAGPVYLTQTTDPNGSSRDVLKAHPLCSQHRGMLQRVEAGMAAFRLAPTGRPIPPPERAEKKSPLAQLQAVQRAG
jgi:hypothetical protein